ncbi:MAG: MtrB/PioB family decaheme-associated outer membrane protein [Betaproteobacteria bacterium]
MQTRAGMHWLTSSPFAGGRLATLVAGFAFASLAHAAAVPTEAATDTDALAELTRPSSTIDIGAGAVSEGSFAAGNYTGLDRKGGYAIGGVDLRGSQYSYGNPADDKTRWRFTGTNLGLSSRNLAGEYGRQGAYRITFGYDALPRLYTDSYQTPFLGAGSTSLTLPAGFVRGADTAAMDTLAGSLRAFDVEVNRRRAEAGVSYWLSREWELRASLRNDDREGTRLRGAEFGSNGGNARAVLLPEPIDSSTHLIDMSLAFNGEDQRFTFSYHGSLFRNHVGSLAWQNPFSNAPWVGGTSGLPAGFPLANGQTGVAPDNQFHQLSASGAYEFSSTTRLTLTGSRGRMTQSEAFLPYTINPGLTATPLPRNALNGLVDTTFLHARLFMRPMRNLNVNATLKYEDRDNRTPLSEFIYVGGDIQLQPPAGSNSDRIRTNLPRSRRLEQLVLEADYRVAAGIAAKAGWDHETITRTYAEVERTSEDTWRLELRRGGSGPWTANASYALLVRRGTSYQYNAPYLASYTSAAFIDGLASANGCAVLADCVRNGPLQNKFFLADRDRQRSRLLLGFMPDAAVSLQARLDVNRDRYPHSPYGVTDASNWSASADLGYVFSDDASATLFYAFEDQRSRERSRQVTNSVVAGSADADWFNQLTDRTSSIGAGLRYQGLLGGRLQLSADAIAVRGRTPISTSVGAGVPAAQNPATALPDLSARSDHLNLTARYAVDRRATLQASYFFRRLNSADWAYQQVAVATLANLIGTAQVPPRYRVHGIGVSYQYTFR